MFCKKVKPLYLFIGRKEQKSSSIIEWDRLRGYTCYWQGDPLYDLWVDDRILFRKGWEQMQEIGQMGMQILRLPVDRAVVTAGYKNIAYRDRFRFHHYGCD